MESQQIILANKPRLLRTLLRSMFDKMPGFDVVREITELEDLPAAMEQTNAQWLIVPLWLPGKMPAVIESILKAHPSANALGIAANGGKIVVKQNGVPEEPLDDISLDGLLAVLQQRQREPAELQEHRT